MEFLIRHKFVLFLFLLLSVKAFSQEVPPAPPVVYPKIVGYVSVLHPIVVIDENASTFNFKYSYTVAFPVGINLLKSDRIGFSFEIAPIIKADKHSHKVSNFLFHPGILFRFKHGFTFITRAAFETSGRYGVTPVFSKVIAKGKSVNYFVATPLPVRFGNEKPPSVGANFQVGITF